MRVALLTPLVQSTAVVGLCLAGPAAANHSVRPWLDDLTLVITHDDMDPHRARQKFESAGGRVAVVVPPRSILGWIPPSHDGIEIQEWGTLHRRPVRDAWRYEDRTTRAVIDFFEEAVTWKRRLVRDPTGSEGTRLEPDVLVPSISLEEVKRNLRALEPSYGQSLNLLGPAVLGESSESMAGTVWVSLFFVESDGSGDDPNLFDWDEAAEQAMFKEAMAGLTWWAREAQTQPRSDCWVAFYVKPYFATSDARCWQWREPALHSSSSFIRSIHDVLENFGYGSGSSVDRASAFNLNQRSLHGTDRAFCAFLATSQRGHFSDGITGRAFLGGPHLVQMRLKGADAAIFAHEAGHIFGACDEYPRGCNCHHCSNGVDNHNCANCNPESVSCMMRDTRWQLCPWTPGHVGWSLDPCAPEPLPAPVLDSVSPFEMEQGASDFVALTGSNFTHSTRTDFGAGVRILAERYWSPTTLLVELSVEPDALAGPRDVIVTTPDLQADTLEAGLTVVTRTDVLLLEFALHHDVGRGAVLEWSLQRDRGDAGTLHVLRSEDTQPRAWHTLTRLPLHARGFEDTDVQPGRWVYALMLKTIERAQILAERTLRIEAPQSSLILLGNTPNPFNASTRIHLRLGKAGPVDVRIYDLRGRLVRQLRTHLSDGERSVLWDARDHERRPQPSGQYIYEVRIDGAAARARMTLVR